MNAEPVGEGVDRFPSARAAIKTVMTFEPRRVPVGGVVASENSRLRVRRGGSVCAICSLLDRPPAEGDEAEQWRSVDGWRGGLGEGVAVAHLQSDCLTGEGVDLCHDLSSGRIPLLLGGGGEVPTMNQPVERDQTSKRRPWHLSERGIDRALQCARALDGVEQRVHREPKPHRQITVADCCSRAGARRGVAPERRGECRCKTCHVIEHPETLNAAHGVGPPSCSATMPVPTFFSIGMMMPTAHCLPCDLLGRRVINDLFEV